LIERIDSLSLPMCYNSFTSRLTSRGSDDYRRYSPPKSWDAYPQV